jgi:hypothetical protein
MSASIALKRLLLVALVFPGLASAQVLRYASPTGSASNPGSRQSPWNIIRSVAACSNDTTIILLDGIYLQDSTATWEIGTGSGRSRMISDSGATPVFVRNSGGAPRIYPTRNTTLDGIWIGGRGMNDSISQALGHGSARALATGDSILNCVIFNTWGSGLILGGGHSVVIKNNLFVNCGMTSDGLSHALYVSTPDPANASQAVICYRNAVINSSPEQKFSGNRLKWASRGYGIHFWHNPTYSKIIKNFTNIAGVHHGRDVVCRDNVFWQGGMEFMGLEGLTVPFDSVAVDTPHVWRRNILVKSFTEGIQNFCWPDPIAERGNPAHPYVMWWDGDSTWLSNQWRELGQGYVRSFGTINRTINFNYPADVSALLGVPPAITDTAVARLARDFYDKTAQQVHQNGTVLNNWQILLDVLDFWQGTREERADKNTTSASQEDPGTPTRYSLSQNYPNPFNPRTTIQFAIPRSSEVTLRVFDALGREVATLVDAFEAAGTHTVEFDGEGLASGVYFYRLRAGDFESTRKLIVVK